jgi:hypothetical protein
MLERGPADTGYVIHRTLVFVAVACSALVIGSFALFARDQLAGASKHQQHELVTDAASPAVPVTHHHPRQPRRFIDGAAHGLTSPFSSIVQSDNRWVSHGVPTFFALAVYGLGLGFLARFSRGMT